MAPHQFFSLLLLTPLFFFVFISPSHSSSDAAALVPASSAGSQKVDLSLYYEALCPYCANFMVNHLVKLFQTKIISIVNLRLVPWGNAEIINSTGSFSCQHGEDECLLNTVDACAINVWPDLNTHYRMIYCIERLALEGKHKDWPSCFQKLGLPWKPVQDCYNGGHGIQLELQYAKETAQLNPPHLYVPWVTVNNQPLGEDYEKYLSYVCKAYKGPDVPKTCKSFPSSLEISSSEKANLTHHEVCYFGDARNLTSSAPIN